MNRITLFAALLACVAAGASASSAVSDDPRVHKIGSSGSAFVDFAVMHIYSVDFGKVDINNGHTIFLEYSRGRADMYYSCGSAPTLSSSKFEGGVHRGIHWYRFTQYCSSSRKLFIGIYGYTATNYKLRSTHRATLETRPGPVVNAVVERPSEALYYRFVIPPNIALIQFPFQVTSTGSWRMNLRVRKDYLPNSSSFTWSKEGSTTETCMEAKNPSAGTYYLSVARRSSPSGSMATKFQIILNGLDGCTFGFNHHPQRQSRVIAAEPVSPEEVALLEAQALLLDA